MLQQMRPGSGCGKASSRGRVEPVRRGLVAVVAEDCLSEKPVAPLKSRPAALAPTPPGAAGPSGSQYRPPAIISPAHPS